MHWAADITFATHSAAMEAGAVLIARYESFHNFREASKYQIDEQHRHVSIIMLNHSGIFPNSCISGNRLYIVPCHA